MSSARWLVPITAFALALVGRTALRRARTTDLRGQVVLITGSSRGLGLALAREFARARCRLVLCARMTAELERARQTIPLSDADVLTQTCDVTDRQQVASLIQSATQRFGRVDILVTNAGQIGVGPLATQTVEDFERMMAVMFWGVVYPTVEVLPQMRARRTGRIATITSIGGKVSVPHLLPYSAAKFAAVGFSEGLRAELARDGITVTTVVPGLMRTGSHLNAEFKGQHRKEFLWFSLGATLPLSSMSAEDAAHRIVAAIARGDAEIILSWQAWLLARAQGLAPALTSDVLGLVNRILPGPGGMGEQAASGWASQSPLTRSALEALGRRAAERLNQTS
jgi:short-subunit dehydrogenase